MITILCLIFFVSGASALIFESLWFNLLGLSLGNSVWATAVVLASFMAGLALGNALAALKGQRVIRPIRWFAVLQGVIAVSGTALVVFFPRMPHLLVPLWRLFLDHGLLINGSRMLIAFLLMLVPTTAMGATLPMLVKAVYNDRAHFGRILGLLYGINTLGAVLGVLLTELYFMDWFGLQNTGILAGLLNGLAALSALVLTHKKKAPPVSAGPGNPLCNESKRLLVAAFLCGFILLALEVIWFRFLLLFFSGVSLNFSIMLAVVLLGISLGGIACSAWFRRGRQADAMVVALAAANGILIVLLYTTFSVALQWRSSIGGIFGTILLPFFLMFPIAFVSGSLFTLIGHSLQKRLQAETRSTGLLTLANTLGSVCGSVAAGLLLIRFLGMELSFFIMALLYGVVAFAVTGKPFFSLKKARKTVFYLLLIAYALPLAFFPFGKLFFTYAEVPRSRYMVPPYDELVYYKESLTETIQYIATSWLNQPLFHRLITNDHSMSATNRYSRRYMKLYVYWPVALHPKPRKALLLCYGCGSTAQALTECEQLAAIDIVDISSEILAASSIVFPEPRDNPMADPRVTAFIEDGRFFLLTRENSYDIISAEPPPPTFSGVQNLYSEEFFTLINKRLRPGGMATYWLPVRQMDQAQAKAVLRAFANSFDHVSLWTGADLEWMMVGIKSPLPSVSADHFSLQWHNPAVAAEMEEVGLHRPQQMAALYLADRARIDAFTGDQPPVRDNYPKRLSYVDVENTVQSQALFRDFMAPEKTYASFTQSPFIAALWPDTLRQAAKPYFSVQPVVNRMIAQLHFCSFNISNLHACLHNPLLHDYILWSMGSGPSMQHIMQNALAKDPELGRAHLLVYVHLAAAALRDGDYAQAETYMRRYAERLASGEDTIIPITFLRIYLLYLQHDKAAAQALGKELQPLLKRGEEKRYYADFITWLKQNVTQQEAAE